MMELTVVNLRLLVSGNGFRNEKYCTNSLR